MKKMRVMMVTSSRSIGGAENHIFNLCNYLRSRSSVVSVLNIASGETGFGEKISGAGIDLIPFPISSLRELVSPLKLGALRRTVRTREPDLIHGHLYHGEVVAAIASFLCGRPAITTRHSCGLEFEGGRRLATSISKRMLKRVIAVSGEAAREAAAQGFGGGEIVTLPNAVDSGLFRPVKAEEKGPMRDRWIDSLFGEKGRGIDLLIGTMGGLKEVKNFPIFIRMAERVAGELASGPSNPGFIILGEGPERGKLEELCSQTPEAVKIAMPGFAGRPESLLPLLDIFVLPSFTEGVPMALLEAMSCGTACIASDVGGMPEVVGSAGTIVRSGDLEGFASAVVSMARESEKREETGCLARKRVETFYDTAAWGEKTMEIYRDAIAGRRTDAHTDS